MSQGNGQTRTIFFAAFEPSGDVLAARLIEELKRRDPLLRFTGFGGPKMQAHGADLIQVTTEHAAAMGGFAGEVKTHLKRCGVMSDYLKAHDIAAFVPVDSPAANWALCKRVKRHRPNAKVVHLVCPQVWSWAQWRVRRLRKLSDLVLCLLPFEPGWLDGHGVEGVFVGHPVFEDAPAAMSRSIAEDLPKVDSSDAVRLALMPGSRRSELEMNWPTMLTAYNAVREANPSLVGVVAARVASDVETLRKVSGETLWPEGLHVVPGRTEEVLAWCDAALVKSGTSTLQVASLEKPMVAFYNVSPVKWQALGRWLINSRTFTLPNIISEWQDGRRVIPEFVPNFGDHEAIAEALKPLVTDATERDRQRVGLQRIAEPFASVTFKTAAADALLSVLT
jgi:lipid-A-disaccharide synthase